MQLTQEIVGVTQARDELPRRLRGLESGEVERVVIVRHNNPVAVILRVEEYERMKTIEAERESYEDVIALVQALRADDGTRYSLEDIKREFGIE